MAIHVAVGMKIAAMAEIQAAGLVVFNDGRSDYPEALQFEALNKNGAVFSNAMLANGKRVEIPNVGIVAVIDAPPAMPSPKVLASAPQVFQQIDGVLRRYPRNRFPEVAQKLDALAARWRTAQSSKAASIPAALSTGKPKLTITTTDGQRFDGVVITKVSAGTVSFEHSAGIATIELAKLPAEWQQKFNYDPEKAAAPKVTKMPIDPATPLPRTAAKNGESNEADRDYIPRSKSVYENLKKLSWSPELGKAADEINTKMHGVIDFPKELPNSMDALFADAFRGIADQLDRAEKISAQEYWLAGFASSPPADDLETKSEWDVYTRGGYEISDKMCGYTYGVFCGTRVAYINAIALDAGVPDSLIQSPEGWLSAPEKLANAFTVGTTGDVDARVESTFGKHTLAEQSEGFQVEFQKGVIHGYGEGIRLYMYGKLSHFQWRPLAP